MVVREAVEVLKLAEYILVPRRQETRMVLLYSSRPLRPTHSDSTGDSDVPVARS